MITDEDKLQSEIGSSEMGRAFADGVLFTLSIGKKSWTQKLEPSDFNLAEFPANFMPGRRGLLPLTTLQEIDSIEGSARRLLVKRSFNFGDTTRSQIRFVRNAAVGDMLVELNDYKTAYFAAVNRLIENYETHKQQMHTEFPEQWPKLCQFYIHSQDILKHYYFEFSMRQMSLPTRLGRVDAASFMSNRNADDAYKKNVERLLEDERNKARNMMASFVDESLRMLRGKVVETFQSMIDRKRDNKDLVGRNIKTIRESIKYVEDMDFLNDSEFREQLNAVKAQIDSGVEFKDNDAAVTELNRLLQNTVDFVSNTTDTAAAKIKTSYFGRKLSV